MKKIIPRSFAASFVGWVFFFFLPPFFLPFIVRVAFLQRCHGVLQQRGEVLCLNNSIGAAIAPCLGATELCALRMLRSEVCAAPQSVGGL